MPIKWSPLMVAEATDMIEQYVSQAALPLEQVRIVAREARKIPNIPQYIDQHFLRIIGEVDRIIGGSYLEPVGRFKTAIQGVREALPDGAAEAEKRKRENQLSLVA